MNISTRARRFTTQAGVLICLQVVTPSIIKERILPSLKRRLVLHYTFFDSNIFAALFDVVPARFHASAMGLVLCAAFVVGSSSGGLTGLFTSQSMGLASLAPVYFAGGILLLIARGIGGERRDE